MKKRVLMAILCIAMICTVLSGCKKTEESIESETTETVSEVTETKQEDTESTKEVFHPEGLAKSYLTGEWIDEELAAKRPIAMMIENTSVCLPQYGIGQADVIYECPVEGGISRLLAFFQDYSQMERIGNVRSSRPYYVYFAKEFDAIYVHAGGSVEAYEVLDTRFIDDLDAIKGNAVSSFYRVSDKKAPHNLYISSDAIDSGIDSCDYRTELDDSYDGHFQFAEDDEEITLSEGEDAAVVSLYLVNPKPWFVYNEEDGLYYRYEFGKEQVDAITGEQLAVKNIIIEECGITYYDENKGYLNIDITSGGKGKYITNGKCIDITWEKKSDTTPTHYYDMNGEEITLNQGKTWVAITQNTYSDRNKIYATIDEYNSSK